MKIRVVPIISGALEIMLKTLEELVSSGTIENIQTIIALESATVLKNIVIFQA